MDLFRFDEPQRDGDRIFFGVTLDVKFAIECLKTPSTENLERDLDEYAAKISKGRDYLNSDYAYEFLGDGILLKAIHAPCFGYGGALEMMSFCEELLLAGPEHHNSSKVFYGAVNIPTEESYEDLKKLFGFWTEAAGKIIRG